MRASVFREGWGSESVGLAREMTVACEDAAISLGLGGVVGRLFCGRRAPWGRAVWLG